MGIFEWVSAYGVMLVGSAVYAFVVGAALGAGGWVAWRLLERRRVAGPASEPGVGWMLWVLVPIVLVWAVWVIVAAPQWLPPGLPPAQQRTFMVLQFVPFIVMMSLVMTGIWLVRKALR